MNPYADFMKKWLLAGLILGTVINLQAQSAYNAQLDGFQEVPPNASPGYGSADLTLNGTTLSIDANTGAYSSLLGGATAVTINDAAVNANGPTVISLTLDTPGATDGTFQGSGTLTAQQITDLNAGNLYINLRSPVFPSGEIRGQIESVPEPSTLALASATVLALLAQRRRA
jgi:hypothetical protein